MNLLCKRPWTQNLEFKNQQREQKSYHHPFVHDHSPGKRSHSCKQHSFVLPNDRAFDPLSTYNSYLCTQSTLIKSSICQNVITSMATKFSFFSKRPGTSIICKVVSSLPQFGGSAGDRKKVPKTLNFKARPSTKFYLREKDITIITTEWPTVLGAPDSDFAGL